MKKIFKMIGIISLTVFSFFVTEKTALVINTMDEIMVRITEDRKNYEEEPIDAVIVNNTIIPGISGRKVNINKSYKNMKKNGYYNSNFLIYDYIKPKISLKDNINKYIIKGNSKKRMISLIFLLRGNLDIKEVLEILNNYDVKANFFVDTTWFSNNSNLLYELVNNDHNVGIILDNYDDYDFESIDLVLKNISKDSNGFCYSTKENTKNIEACSVRNNYTIRPKTVSDKNPLIDIKNNIDNENLFSLTVNRNLKKELSTIIIYIKSKGYTIENLNTFILE